MELRTTFPIAASSERVWGVLTDFGRYPEWNPSLPSIKGEPTAGATLSLTLAMPGRPAAKVKARLTEVVPGRRLIWDGNVGSDRIFSGHREFLIDPQPDGTVSFTHVEDVSGLLSPVFRLLMGSAVQAHHDGFNDALKRRAETPG